MKAQMKAHVQSERRPLKCYGEPGGEGDGADASAYWSYNFRDPIKSIRDPLSVVNAPSAMVNTSLAKEGPFLNPGRDNSKVVNAPAPLKR